MSAEGKKKRGISGQANAKSSPFRLNGWLIDWEARKLGCHTVPPAASSGRKSLQGIIGGIIAERAGYGSFGGSEAIYDRMIAHAEDRIPGSVSE